MHISAKTKKDEKIKDKRQIINKTLEPYTKKQPQILELQRIIPIFAPLRRYGPYCEIERSS